MPLRSMFHNYAGKSYLLLSLWSINTCSFDVLPLDSISLNNDLVTMIILVSFIFSFSLLVAGDTFFVQSGTVRRIFFPLTRFIFYMMYQFYRININYITPELDTSILLFRNLIRFLMNVVENHVKRHFIPLYVLLYYFGIKYTPNFEQPITFTLNFKPSQHLSNRILNRFMRHYEKLID